MAMVLANEEHQLYDDLKGVYAKVRDYAEGYEVRYLHMAVDHYNSYRGWVGRNSWYVLPAVAAVFYALGKYARYLHAS